MNTEIIEQVDDIYRANPIIKVVLQLTTPIGSVIDVAFEEIHKDRLRALLDELAKGDVPLTKEIIESEDCIHCCIYTVRAALNTRRREKIRCFARLLTSSINSPEITVDEYEEYLSILDEISYRELGVLATLSRYEREYPHQAEESDYDHRVRFWNHFSDKVCSKFSIPMEVLSSILTRLNRTGLYVTATGYSSPTEASLNFVGRIGDLTPLYKKFEKLIRPDDGEFK